MAMKKTVAGLALCLAVTIQLSLVAAEDIRCIRRDKNIGHCRTPTNCSNIAKMMERKKVSGKYTRADHSYILKSANLTCSRQKKLCCEDEYYRGIDELTNQSCGKCGTIKVYGGIEILLMSRPWMALLETRQPLQNDSSFTCGGTLIHKRFVLTAAHCFKNLHLVKVRLGEHDKNTEPDCRTLKGNLTCAPNVTDVTAEQVFIHEKFNSITFQYDIALIKLSRDVYSTESIMPICLPLTEELQRNGETMESFKVTGWGGNENGDTSPVPKEATLNYVNHTECKFYHDNLVSHHLCAGNDEGVDACPGDSGGPLMQVGYVNELQRFVQYGIVSFGKASCAIGEPAVFTKVTDFLRWIATTMGAHYG